MHSDSKLRWFWELVKIHQEVMALSRGYIESADQWRQDHFAEVSIEMFISFGV